MFDPVQAPSLRHAFELVNAAILEADSRLRHQILDRARDQDFAGTRFRGDATIAMNRWLEILRSGADPPIVAPSSNKRSPRSCLSISSGPPKTPRGWVIRVGHR